jgi:cytochrome c oxidase assembly protein subunit 15
VNADDAASHNRGLHRLALLTAVATFPLIFMGGLVTSHDSGLSVPDWPNSYGYNMFLFPISLWQGGIFYEHAHRLMGTVVGYAAVMLACWAWGAGRNPAVRRWLLGATVACGVAALAIGIWLAVGHPGGTDKLMSRAAQGIVSFVGLGLVLFAAWMSRTREPRRWVRWLCVGVLGTVIVQGMLGGLRVVLLKLDLAIVHACLAQAFFCLVGLVVIVTSKWWTVAASQRDADATPVTNRSGRTLTRLAVLAWALIYLQLIVGATMRHYRAGLAIPDLPLAFGRVIPPTNPTDLQAAQVRMMPADEWYHVDEHTLGQVWLAFGHRVGAVVVTVAILWLAAVALRDARGRRGGLFAPTLVLLGLLIVQVTLGVLTVLMKKPADVASAHVAVGALVLLTTFVVAVRSMRLYAPVRATDRARGFEPVRDGRPIPGGASPAIG